MVTLAARQSKDVNVTDTENNQETRARMKLSETHIQKRKEEKNVRKAIKKEKSDLKTTG